MERNVPRDQSNGYEEIAEQFMSARNPRIGPATVREWSRRLARGASILELGCGHGAISQVLAEEGFVLYGLDASAKMIAAFRRRFPAAQAECAAAEDSELFGRTFDGVVAWGLMFLLPTDLQAVVIGKVARALNREGHFLFTATRDAVTWEDGLSGRASISLGRKRYLQLLADTGLEFAGEDSDEGGNYYYFASKL